MQDEIRRVCKNLSVLLNNSTQQTCFSEETIDIRVQENSLFVTIGIHPTGIDIEGALRNVTGITTEPRGQGYELTPIPGVSITGEETLLWLDRQLIQAKMNPQDEKKFKGKKDSQPSSAHNPSRR